MSEVVCFWLLLLLASVIDMPDNQASNAGEMSGDEISCAMGNLAQAINDLRTDRVPPPVTFSGLGGASAVNSFFLAFEKYATSVYKQDFDSWYQVLPSFLDGEAKSIVRAFGRDASYEVVKQRLIAECTNCTTLTSNDFAGFFSASRHSGESLVCFSIRLESLARRVAVASPSGREVMVKSKFLSSLPSAILDQLNIQLGHKESASLSEVVRLATILESQNVSWNRSGSGQVSAVVEDEYLDRSFERKTMVCSYCNKPGHVEKNCFARKASNIKCYHCGRSGHMVRNCPDKQHRDTAAEDQVVVSAVCDFCGLGRHSLANCEVFKRRCFACVWCGSVDHESFRCAQKPTSSGN